MINNLDLPIEWQNYYTKYPHGHSLLEIICDWATSVNLMVDQLNLTQEQIDKLFTDTLPENIETVLNEWYDSGKITTIINTFMNGTVNVKHFGAVGDGVTDDTAAIQSAINSGAGVIIIPDGTYLIDGDYQENVQGYGGLLMESNQHLKLSPQTILQIKTTSSGQYAGIQVDSVENVLISGGKIQGERLSHTGVTGEWGHGIYVRGSKRITIEDIYIEKCWGDGLCVGSNISGLASEFITLDGVISDNNRRQGLSLGKANHITIKDSTFSNTNGAMPMSGIDIEPDAGEGSVFDILIENCHIFGNESMGLEAHYCDDVTVKNCRIYDNYGGIYLLGDALRHANIHSIGNTFENNLSHLKPNDYCTIKSEGDIFKNLNPIGTGAILFDGVPSFRRVDVLNSKFNQKENMWGIYWNTSEANTLISVDHCTFNLHGSPGYENYYGKFLSFANNKYIVESDYLATAALDNKYPLYFRNAVLVENCKFINLGNIPLRLAAAEGVMQVIDCLFTANYGFIKPDLTEVTSYYHGN